MTKFTCPDKGFHLGFPCSKCEEHYNCRLAVASSSCSEIRTNAVKATPEKIPQRFVSRPERSSELWDADKYKSPVHTKIMKPDENGNLVVVSETKLDTAENKINIPREVLRACSMDDLIKKIEGGKVKLIHPDIETLKEVNGKSFLSVLRGKRVNLNDIADGIKWSSNRGTYKDEEKVTKIFENCRPWSFWYYLEEADEATINARLAELTERYNLIDGQWK